MYLSLLLSDSNKYVQNALLSGFFMGLGAFATYSCIATIIHFAKEFILDFDLIFNDFFFAVAPLMLMVAGISEGLNGISDYPKAKAAFISLFKIIRTNSLIPPFYEDNRGKIEPDNLKGKIEFRNVTFAYPTKPEIDILLSSLGNQLD